FDWRGGVQSAKRAAESPSADFYASEAFRQVADGLEAYAPTPDCNLTHSYFARKTQRTMLIEEVEAIWAPIAETDDWSLFHQTLAEIAEMRAAYGMTV